MIPDGASLVDVALAYVLSYPEVSCVIPGIRTPEQLEVNLAASGRSLDIARRERFEAFWDEVTSGGRELLPW
jgi:aryl-alcohol dehydrogenase-like predicted oxidoreductase